MCRKNENKIIIKFRAYLTRIGVADDKNNSAKEETAL
jgi:hypothetical protein